MLKNYLIKIITIIVTTILIESACLKLNEKQVESDLIAEYLLNNLLRPSSSGSSNRNNNDKSNYLTSKLIMNSLPSKSWMTQEQPIDLNNDDDFVDNSKNLYSSLLFDTINTNYNNNDNYENGENNQEIGWFDGPVLPKIAPLNSMNDINGDNDDDTYFDNLKQSDLINDENGEEVIESSINPYSYLNSINKQQQSIDTNNNNNKYDSIMNLLLANYYLQQFSNEALNDDKNNEINKTIARHHDNDNDNNLEKRRQKIIKHESTTTTTMRPSSTSTAATYESLNRSKSLSLHKHGINSNSNSNKLLNSNGQKEYAMLRPPSANDEIIKNTVKNNKDMYDNEWPSELEQDNLFDNEKSLKQQPKQHKKRMVMITSNTDANIDDDVWKWQLDSLKKMKH